MKKRKSKGYYGFASKKDYEAYYSDLRNWAWEIPMMEAHTKEAEAERESEKQEKISEWTLVSTGQPRPHARYLVRRGGDVNTATP